MTELSAVRVVARYSLSTFMRSSLGGLFFAFYVYIHVNMSRTREYPSKMKEKRAMRSTSTEHMQRYALGNIDAAVEVALAALGKTAFWHATS